MEELDTEWIDSYDNKEKQFIERADLAIEDIKTVNIFNLYINKRNDLEKIKILEHPIEKCLKKDELIKLIKEKQFDENIKYKLMSILKYNITLKQQDLYSFINETSTPNYLESIQQLDDINFDSGLDIFDDLHSIYILYYEKQKSNITKKNLPNMLRKTKKQIN